MSCSKVFSREMELGADGGVTGNFRVLCDGEHEDELTEAEEKAVEAIATQAIATPAMSTCRSA